jgi:Zn-dependent protease
MNYLISLVILIFSAIVHEVMHGVVAEKLGDSTARDEGRITLNPIPHIDPFGSIILPLLLLAVGSPIILGAAKPVPVNFHNLRNPKQGMALVSLAGPFANFALALILAIPIKLGLTNALSGPILLQAVLINIVLGTFNLIPIPPLDGSKVLAAFAPDRWMYKILEWERFGFLLILLFLYAGLLDVILLPVVRLFSSLLGLSFF